MAWSTLPTSRSPQRFHLLSESPDEDSRRGSATTWGGNSPLLAFGSPTPDGPTARGNLIKWSLKRGAVVLVVVVAAVVLLQLGDSASPHLSGTIRSTLSYVHQQEILKAGPEPPPPFDKMLVRNFVEPQDSLKVQLKTEVRYITTMSYGGHANQFIAIYHLLFLGKITSRVVIIPTLNPLHFGNALPVPLSQFFDLDRFYQDTQIPIIELADLKYFSETNPPATERISCWSVHQRVTPGGSNNNDGSMGAHKINVDMWAMPEFQYGSESTVFWYNELLAFDMDYNGRKDWIEQCKRDLHPQRPLPRGRTAENMTHAERVKNLYPSFDPLHSPEPRDEFLCLDTTLFFGSYRPPPPYPPAIPIDPPRSYEGEGWIEAGQYLRFNNHVEDLVDAYLLQIFNVSMLAQIPPLITVHIRRGDFDVNRGLTSLDKYTDAVDRVRRRLRQRRNDPDGWIGPGKANVNYFPRIDPEDFAVVATTDESPDSPFVQDLLELGWKVVDHDALGTESRLSGWYPTILDQAILARGHGFVGTEWSTYSMLGGLRVKYWNGGVEEFTPSIL